MQNHYELLKIKKRNRYHLLNTTILGILSMLFVYAVIATVVALIITFFSPLLGIVVWFAIIGTLFTIKWRQNKMQYHDAIDNFLQFYHAQLLFPTMRYQKIFDVLDEICIGMDIQRPDVYLVDLHKFAIDSPIQPTYDHPEDANIYDLKPFVDHVIQNNIFGLQIENRTIMVINQDLLDNLDRYELEAAMAIELGYTKNLFNTFLIYHHITYDTINKFINVILGLTAAYLYILFGGKHHHAVHISNFETNLAIWAMILFAIFYVLKRIGYATFHHHNLSLIKHLNANAIALTQNPQILISALKKIDENNYQPKGESIYNNLWINPFTDESGDNQNPNFLMQIYLWIAKFSSIATNQLFNQRLRIPISEQIQLIYKTYQLNPNDKQAKYQSQKEPYLDLQNEAANNFDETHIHTQYLN